MSLFHFRGWHCRFTAEGREQLPKRVSFSNSNQVCEAARRGNGLVDNSVREALDLAIEIGRGGIWLMLTNEQFQALGGVP